MKLRVVGSEVAQSARQAASKQHRPISSCSVFGRRRADGRDQFGRAARPRTGTAFSVPIPAPFKGANGSRRGCNGAVTRAVACSSVRDLEGERVVVVGLGVSGRAAVQLAVDRGAVVTATDVAPDALEGDELWKAGMEALGVRFELGPHEPQTLRNATQIVLSPGVPYKGTLMQLVYPTVPVHSELGFAAAALPRSLKTVAVTGTNGKSTVTGFTGQLLQSAGVDAWVGGNYGVPLSELALALRRGQLLGVQVAVVEVSSYQLEVPSSSFRPNAAVLLNLTPDHLQRHGSMEAYAEAKCSMFKHMDSSSVAFIPEDELCQQKAAAANSSLTFAEIGRLPGVRVIGRRATVKLPGKEQVQIDLHPFRCTGAHNLVNAAVAIALVFALDLPNVGEVELQGGLAQLQMLRHRMEAVGTVDGVVWINDSKATNVDAAFAGINGLEQPAVVLLGGSAKRLMDGTLGFRYLVSALSCHRAVVTFGQDGKEIANELTAAGVKCHIGESLIDAAEVGMQLAQTGDALLLSPGCASFDEFRNFEHRGDTFVQLLAERQGRR